jgi:hypothetical protein
MRIKLYVWQRQHEIYIAFERINIFGLHWHPVPIDHYLPSAALFPIAEQFIQAK